MLELCVILGNVVVFIQCDNYCFCVMGNNCFYFQMQCFVFLWCGGKGKIEMWYQCLLEWVVLFVGEVESGKFVCSVQLWECVFCMFLDCCVYNVILCQLGVIFFIQGKVGYYVFGVVVKNVIIVVQFYLSLCGNVVFCMDMVDIDVYVGEILFQFCVVVIVIYLGNVFWLYVVVSVVYCYIDCIIVRKCFIQLWVDIDVVIVDCCQGFYFLFFGSSV